MAPYSSTLAWKIPWTEGSGGLQSMGFLGAGHNWAIHFIFSLSCIGWGNGNPLQCSCLENPRDGGAWWAAIYGVAQSRTRLKWLSSSSSIKKNSISFTHVSQRVICKAPASESLGCFFLKKNTHSCYPPMAYWIAWKHWNLRKVILSCYCLSRCVL